WSAAKPSRSGRLRRRVSAARASTNALTPHARSEQVHQRTLLALRRVGERSVRDVFRRIRNAPREQYQGQPVRRRVARAERRALAVRSVTTRGERVVVQLDVTLERNFDLGR